MLFPIFTYNSKQNERGEKWEVRYAPKFLTTTVKLEKF